MNASKRRASSKRLSASQISAWHLCDREAINIEIAKVIFKWTYYGGYWVTPDGCIMSEIPDFLNAIDPIQKPEQDQSENGESQKLDPAAQP